MKRLMIALCLLASSMFAQATDLTVYIAPFQLWSDCYLSPACAAQQLYLMEIKTTNTNTVAYLYSVTGTLADGTDENAQCLFNATKVGANSCIVFRAKAAPANAMFPTAPYQDTFTITQMLFSGPVTNVRYHVQELSVTSDFAGGQ